MQKITEPATHPLIAALVPTPGMPIQSVRFIGYIGPSSNELNVRIYESPLDLSRWIDVLQRAILYVETAPQSVAPHGATYVWVRSDSPVELPPPPPATAAQFDEGRRNSISAQADTENLYLPLARKERGDTETDGGTSTGGTAGGTGG
jgi:hypothetical protein